MYTHTQSFVMLKQWQVIRDAIFYVSGLLITSQCDKGI